MIEYALNATPRQGERRSVMSQDHTWPGAVASRTGGWRGVLDCRRVGATGRMLWSGIAAAIRHQVRREASMIPASQAVAKAWSTETPSAQPASIRWTTCARSWVLIRDG